MKALTLTQPWASLVAVGAKQIETRGWYTSHRGLLAIHAGKGLADMSKDEYIRLCHTEPFASALRLHYEAVKDIPRGAIVAICRLIGCLPTPREGAISVYEHYDDDGRMLINTQIPPAEPERSFGNFEPGRFAWILADVHRLAEPIPARGALGLWDWQPGEDVLRALEGEA